MKERNQAPDPEDFIEPVIRGAENLWTHVPWTFGPPTTTSEPRPLHPGYRAIWWALHGLGFLTWAAFLALGYDRTPWLTAYGAAFALVEAAALARKFFKDKTADGTWSWVSWAFLAPGQTWRVFVSFLWSVWLVGAFVAEGPGPDLARLAYIIFGIWWWHHLYREALKR